MDTEGVGCWLVPPHTHLAGDRFTCLMHMAYRRAQQSPVYTCPPAPRPTLAKLAACRCRSLILLSPETSAVAGTSPHLSHPSPQATEAPPIPLASPIHMGFLALVTLSCPSPMTTDFHAHPHPHSPGWATPPQLPSHPGSVLARLVTLAPRVCPQHPPSAP